MAQQFPQYTSSHPTTFREEHHGFDIVTSSLTLLADHLKPKPPYQTPHNLDPYPLPSPTTRRILPSHPKLQQQREQFRLEQIEDQIETRHQLADYRRCQSIDKSLARKPG